MFWDSVVVLPDDIPHLSELGFKDLGFYVSCFCAVLKVCDLILSFNAQDRAQTLHMKMLQQFHMPSIQCPGFTFKKKSGEDNRRVDLEPSGLKLGAVLIQHTCWQST